MHMTNHVRRIAGSMAIALGAVACSPDDQLAVQNLNSDRAGGSFRVDVPAGTAVTHYRHGSDDECAFCPTCVAACLTGVPAFASSGGAGIKPSINGVPPIYVLPVGKTLFESLLLSLVIPDYQPEVRSRKRDDVTWLRSPVMKKAVRKGEEATT